MTAPAFSLQWMSWEQSQLPSVPRGSSHKAALPLPAASISVLLPHAVPRPPNSLPLLTPLISHTNFVLCMNNDAQGPQR